MMSAAPLGLVSAPTGSRLLAHQGGWDEVLLVVGPLAVVAGLLWLANRRVSAQLDAAEAQVELETGTETQAGTGDADGPADGDRGRGDRGLEAPGDVEGFPETDTRS